jgi:hypothetical protein
MVSLSIPCGGLSGWTSLTLTRRASSLVFDKASGMLKAWVAIVDEPYRGTKL